MKSSLHLRFQFGSIPDLTSTNVCPSVCTSIRTQVVKIVHASPWQSVPVHASQSQSMPVHASLSSMTAILGRS